MADTESASRQSLSRIHYTVWMQSSPLDASTLPALGQAPPASGGEVGRRGAHSETSLHRHTRLSASIILFSTVNSLACAYLP